MTSLGVALELLGTRPALRGTLAGSILAPHPYGNDLLWRAHAGAWCTGPSTLALTFTNLGGLQLAPVDDFLSCPLRYCERREELLRAARRDPRLTWLALEVADALPRAAEPIGPRARLEAGIRREVAVKGYRIDRDGTRHEMADSVGYVPE